MDGKGKTDGDGENCGKSSGTSRDSTEDKYVATLKEIELEYEREVSVLEKSLDNNYSYQLQKNKQKPPSNDDKEISEELPAAFFEGNSTDMLDFEIDDETIIIDDSSVIEDESTSELRERHLTGVSNTGSNLMALSDEEVVELSGDEDDQVNEEISLLCMKRPLPIPKPSVECVDILDSDEEFPVCIKAQEKKDFINVEEKKGYVKEYIENEGLGVLHSEEHGLVLFHLDSVWIQGDIKEKTITRQRLKLGQQVSYYEKAFEGPGYKVLCREEVICQAVAVWMGERPKHLMKFIDNFNDHDWARLEEQRRVFILYINGEVFTPVSMQRVRARVQGYLNNELGLCEVQDENGKLQSVFFHVSDVRIYRKTLREVNLSVFEALPVGLHLSLDAKRVHISSGCEVKYQAIAVFAGSWPLVPHPTLLPGGEGTFAPKFNIPDDQNYTFYYLELALESRLQNQINMLKQFLEAQPNGIHFEWRGVRQINCKDDLEVWKSHFDPFYGRRQRRKYDDNRNNKIEVTHTFKAPLIRHFKTKEEMDTGSVIGQAGSTFGGASSLTCSSIGSRPTSALSQFSNKSWKTSTSMIGNSTAGGNVTRTWYNPSTYHFGGLRLKTEVKEELADIGFLGEPSTKRVKTE